MKKRTAAVVTAAGLFLAAGMARAGEGQTPPAPPPPPPPRHGERLKEMDTDGDKKVTFEEFRAYIEKHLRERFDAMDTNHDGVLTPEDRPARRGDRPGRGGEGHRPEGEAGAAK